MAGLGGAPLLPGSDGLVVPRTASGIGVVSMGLLVPEAQALDFASVAQGDTYVWRATRDSRCFGDLLAGVELGALDYLTRTIAVAIRGTRRIGPCASAPAA